MADEKKGDKHKTTPTEEMFGEILKILENQEPAKAEPIEGDPAEILENLDQTLKELKSESNRIADESGMTKEELAAYSQNPDNFTAEEWQLLTRIRDQLDTYRRQAQDLVDQGPSAESQEEKPPKKKKGGRKKGWMQM